MEVITQEIERALDAGLYYLALVCTLTLPDICAALESPTGDTSGKSGEKYKKWCATWLEPYPTLIGGILPYPYPKGVSDELYYLRCGVVHQGRLEHNKSQFSRIVFTTPDTEGRLAHLNVVQGILNLDLLTFCHDMASAASRWFDANQDDTHVKANLPHLVQYRQQALAPYIDGVSGIG